MRSKAILFLILMLVSTCLFSQPTKRLYKEVNVDGKKVNYAIALPDNFDKDQTYPVLIGPSKGTQGSDPTIYWGKEAGRFGWIFIETTAFIFSNAAASIQAVMDGVKSDYKVEGGKFHIVGFSANSAGSFNVALKHPLYFHSVVGIPGYPRTRSPEELKKLKNVFVHFIAGSQDSYWLNQSRNYHDRFKSLGVRTSITVIQGGGHILDSQFGAPFMAEMEKIRKQVTQ